MIKNYQNWKLKIFFFPQLRVIMLDITIRVFRYINQKDFLLVCIEMLIPLMLTWHTIDVWISIVLLWRIFKRTLGHWWISMIKNQQITNNFFSVCNCKVIWRNLDIGWKILYFYDQSILTSLSKWDKWKTVNYMLYISSK